MSSAPTPLRSVLAAVVASAATVAASYAMVIAPQLEVRAGEQQLTARAHALFAGTDQSARRQETKAGQLPGVIADVERTTEQFPGTFEQDRWLDMVTRAAATAGMQLETLTASAPTTPQPLPTTGATTGGADATAAAGDASAAKKPDAPAKPAVAAPAPIAESTVKLTAVGPATSVTAFLRAVESLTRPLMVEKLAVRSEGNGRVRVDLTGRTFLARPLQVPQVVKDTYGLQ